MRSLKFYNIETGKKITVGVEDTMKVQGLLRKLQNDGLLGTKPYHVKTSSGKLVSPTDLFLNIQETDFVIVEGLPVRAGFRQLGIFILDGSGSMLEGEVNGVKPVIALEQAMKETIERFKTSAKTACFLFSVIAFGDTATVMQYPKNVQDIDENNSFNPARLFKGGRGSDSTNIAAGLSLAVDAANAFFNNKEGSLIHRATVVVLSDGMCHHEQETRDVSIRLKQIPGVEVSCCHFETGSQAANSVSLLKEICTNPSRYKTVYDKETIREFFIHSTSTTLRQG